MEEINEKIKIILIEDNKNDAELIIEELKKSGMEPEWIRVETAQELIKQLEIGLYDIIISDYHLPGFGAPEAISIVHEHGRDVPIIIVSGLIGEETAVSLMKSGAHDYVMKGNIKRLPEAIRREIREAIIREDNRQANKKILEALKEKEILIKEIHHRVKNNLQLMLSLLNIQKEKSKNTEFIEETNTIKNRISAIAHIHELIYDTEIFSNINFHDFLEIITGDLRIVYKASSRGITVYIENGPVQLTVEQAIPCGLIINELLTNSFKHAFTEDQENKTITLGINVIDNVVTLHVADNGVVKREAKEKNNTAMSGLKIVDLLITQINGKITTSYGNGSKYVITFLYDNPTLTTVS